MNKYWSAIIVLVLLCVGVSWYFFANYTTAFALTVTGVNVSLILTALSAKNAVAIFDKTIVIACLITVAVFHIAGLVLA